MNDKLPDPFKTARRVAGVTVHLRAEDLLTADANFDRELIDRMLERHGGTLAAPMLGAGIEAAMDIIRREGGRS